MDKTYKVWNLNIKNIPSKLPLESSIAHLSGTQRKRLSFPQSLENSIIAKLSHYQAINSIFISHKSSHILTTSVDQTARVWNLYTGECVVILMNHFDSVTSGVITEDDENIITSTMSGNVFIWKNRTYEFLRIVDCQVENYTLNEIKCLLEPELLLLVYSTGLLNIVKTYGGSCIDYIRTIQ